MATVRTVRFLRCRKILFFIRSRLIRLNPTNKRALNTTISTEHIKNVKSVPTNGSNIFSKSKPKITVGINSSAEEKRKVLYLGLILQCLFSSARFNTVVIPYVKVKPTKSA